jgi:hypothetical protein
MGGVASVGVLRHSYLSAMGTGGASPTGRPQGTNVVYITCTCTRADFRLRLRLLRCVMGRFRHLL